MPAIKFNWFDNWKNHPLSCECGWMGELDDSWCEDHDGLMDFDCPDCKTILAIVLYPTHEESKNNWDKLDDLEKLQVTKRESFLKQFEEESLKSPDQLPDLYGNYFIFVWDNNFIEDKTSILFGETLIWSEPTLYEGFERFVEILGILQSKYGGRLKDLIPTKASEEYLWGDKSFAHELISEARSKLGGR